MSLLPPTSPAAVCVAAGQVKVTWINSQIDHGANHVEISPDGGSTWYTAEATAGPDSGTAGNNILPGSSSYVATGYNNGGSTPLVASTKYDFRVTAECTGVQPEITDVTITTDAATIGGKYFDMEDDVGPVRVWFDYDNGSSPPSIPTNGRLLEVDVDTVDTTAALVTYQAQTAINADSKFTCTAVGAVLTITTSTSNVFTDVTAGDSAVTISVTQDGCSNSTATEIPREIYTMPIGAATVWGAPVGGLDWTHILALKGEEPLITGQALGLASTTRPSKAIITDASVWLWGPAIADPVAFPA